MRRAFVSVLLLCLLALPAFAQQTEINKVDIFTGYTYFTTPNIGLSQQGFNGSFGINHNRWLGLGVDFGIYKGSVDLALSDTKVGPLANAIVPGVAASAPRVPTDATTFTFAAGPQINIRKFKRVTLFVRPGLGLMHESVKPNTTNLAAALTNPTFLASLSPAQRAGLFTLLGSLPTGTTKDTVMFYGAGGGFDVEASKHFGFRFSVDYVHSAMYDNLLFDQNTIRISVGPRFKFGTLSTKK